MNPMMIFSILLVIIGIVGLIRLIFVQIPKTTKESLLNDMWKNGDISDTVYKKYKFEDFKNKK